jgi:hypothetical protein
VSGTKASPVRQSGMVAAGPVAASGRVRGTTPRRHEQVAGLGRSLGGSTQWPFGGALQGSEAERGGPSSSAGASMGRRFESSAAHRMNGLSSDEHE